MDNKYIILANLRKLKADFENTLSTSRSSVSEEKIRSGFLNKLFELFGWNLSDITEVIEEKHLEGEAKKNLISISSGHKKPDYIFCENGVYKMVCDAKNITEDFKNSKSNAFQIRSYSWSMNLPLAMMSNFHEFGVYDTTFIPDQNQDPQFKAIFFTIDDLIQDFDKYSTFFYKDKIQKHDWDISDGLDIKLHNEKSKTLDIAFFEILENFRVRLGQAILENIPKINQDSLNYYTQVIINRVLFIRFLEDLNIETNGTLQSYLNTQNFWESFVRKTVSEFKLKYDGALFDIDLPNLALTNDVFVDFVSSITGNSPYRFDVIKPSFIAEIYDQFLGRQLFVYDNKLQISNKPLSPDGAVPTPYEMSSYICKQTIQLDHISNINDLLKLKILDPCVGSGSFLLATLELLVEKYKTITNSERIALSDVKAIIKNCLYGVDIDPTALEVLKMTLSLKIVMSNFILPEPFSKILSAIDNNFKYGNTIVQEDALMLASEEFEQFPTKFEELFPIIFKEGGFDYVVTNPPYVEPKHFKRKWPLTHRYLKNKYNLSDKVDISMFFVLRINDLLKSDGKYGLVIQKRFFNTEYGRKVRNYLTTQGVLHTIHDFESNYLFKDKTTYIACLFGGSSKTSKKLELSQIRYAKHEGKLNSTRTNLNEVIMTKTRSALIESSLFINRNWSYESLTFTHFLEQKLLHSPDLVVLDDIERLNIGVGPQVLDSRFYFLHDVVKMSDGTIQAFNRRNEKVIIEQDLVRPVLRNDFPEEYNVVRETKDYLIFPYNEDGTLISLLDIQKSFPNGYDYLSYMNQHSTTEKVDNEDEFYRYTRETKLNSFQRPKIFIPMTIKNVKATFIEKNMFGDNSNMNSILDKYDDIIFLKAMCIVFNSKLFNDLAIILSGEASNGYRKLNKQFLKLVPVPILSTDSQNILVNFYEEISKLRNYISNSSGAKQTAYKNKLLAIINKANSKVKSLYNFSDAEIQSIEQLSERK